MTRTWHKVDSLGWLDGSIRTDLTIEERSIWADFLAFCSVSRVEGIISRGEKKPYDLHSIANRLNISEGLLSSAIAKFTQEGMISNDKSGIRITKWAKYNPPVGTKLKPYQPKYPAKQEDTKEENQSEEPEELTPEQLEKTAPPPGETGFTPIANILAEATTATAKAAAPIKEAEVKKDWQIEKDTAMLAKKLYALATTNKEAYDKLYNPLTPKQKEDVAIWINTHPEFTAKL